ALGSAPLPGRWMPAVVLLVAAVLTLWSYRTLLGKEAGVTLIVVLAALKTLELRARRDAFVVFFLGFFLVLTQFLYSQSLLTAASMLVAVWGLLTGLVLAHMPVGQPALRQAAALAARSALLGAPLMALLFLLFPRVAPLWGVPQEALGRTGLSAEMSMGSIAQLAVDDSVAMVLRFPDGQAAPQELLYFRGPVLGDFDGRSWRVLEPRFSGDPPLRTELRLIGKPLRYELTLEPQRLPLLPLLDVTPEAPALEGDADNLRATRRSDLNWVTNRPIVDRLRLTAEAWLAFRHGPRQDEPGLRAYLALPADYNPRTLAWAAQLRSDPRYAQADAHTLATAILQRIRTGGYSYTLTPGFYGDGDIRGKNSPYDAIDEFWLDRKAGFCEHFSAAFVVVMRAMGVPARIVTGYQGAELNPYDGSYVVRQSFAHAWAEYWQPGAGWLRADPTAAVAPDRIQRGLSLRPPRGLVAGAIANVSPALQEQLREFFEAVNNQWNRWVLNYSHGRQLDLLKNLGFDSPNWQDLSLLLIGLLAGLALLGALWAWWDQRRMDPWLRAYGQVQRALAAAGLEAPAHLPPRSLAQRLMSQRPDGAEIAGGLRELDTLRYGPQARDPHEAATLARKLARSLLVRIRKLPRRLPG
ncbi:MAG TPA: DUF3488 and DUF4129 domain-containing transglutaminase family protein, partial [Methylibium sp.]